MKKSKLFILLPLVALTLTGCNNTIVSETTSEAPQESETTKDNGYSSYTLEFSFYYQGVIESLPSGSSIYYAGETNNWSFTPLKESDGSFKLDVGEVEYKTYEYKLLIEYDDKTVSWDNEKVVWPTSGGGTNASFTVSETDGGSQSITCSLSSSLEDILTSGEESPSENSSEGTTTGDTTEGSSSESSSGSGSGNPGEPGTGDSSSSSEDKGTGESSSGDSSSGTGQGGDTGGSEIFTYSIEVEDLTDNTIALSYDGNQETQNGVTLSIKLVTTSSVSGSTSVDATASDVTFTEYDTSLIAFNGLMVYPLTASSSETSFKIVWTAGECTEYGPITVSITDDTEQPAESVTNYTLSFTFWYSETQEYVPSYGELYIAGSWNNTGDSWNNFEKVSIVDNTYTYTFTSIQPDYYHFDLVLTYSDPSYVDYTYKVSVTDGTYLGFTVSGYEDDNHTEPIAVPLSESLSTTLPAPVNSVTLSLSIYYNNTIQTLPEWADLYIAGSWNNPEDNWTEFEYMTPDESKQVFTVTITDIKPGSYTYSLVLVETGSGTGNWNHQLEKASDSGYFDLAASQTEVSLTFNSTKTLEETYPNPSTIQTVTNYTLTFTITYNGSEYELASGASLYVQGDWGDDGSWVDIIEMDTTDHKTFTYTIPSISVGEHTYKVYYNNSNMSSSDFTSTYTWSYELTENVSFTVSDTPETGGGLTAALTSTVDINEVLGLTGDTGGEGGDEGGDWPSGDTITLTFKFTYDSQVETLASYEQIYIIGAWNGGDWNNEDAKLLTLNEDNQTYSVSLTYEEETDVMTESRRYDFNLMITESGASYSWNDDHKLCSENLTWTWADGSLTASYDVELSQPFADYIVDPSTIESRSNCTVTYYFVDNAETPTEYYEIPNYADAYVTGYIESAESWLNYSIGGNTKLTAVGSSASDGYSVTFETIHTGEVTYNMYFEYNSDVTNHTAATSPSWNTAHAIADSSNTTMIIPNTGDCKVYIAQDPNSIISDEPSTMSCTIAIKDTANTGKTPLYCSGSMNSWNNSNTMTYDASVTDYQYSYTFSVEANQELTMGIFNNSSWNDSVQFSSNASEYWNSSNNIVFAGSVVGEYTNTLIILTLDGTNFGTDNHVIITNVSITH